jgi:hypothetical protein
MKAYGRIDDMSGLESKKDEAKRKKFESRDGPPGGPSPYGVLWSKGVTVFQHPRSGGVEDAQNEDIWVEVWENQR